MPLGISVASIRRRKSTSPYPLFKYIAAGRSSSGGIGVDGTLWVWGSCINDANTLVSRYTPTRLGVDSDWAKIFFGNNVFFAIKDDGSLYSWGYNSQGQCGLGYASTTYVTTPTRVGTSNNWRKISCGGWWGGTGNPGSIPIAGIQNDGSLWMWGGDYYGNMGGAVAVNSSLNSPQRLGTGFWNDFETGTYNSIGINTSGNVYTCGRNNYGALGIGSTDSASHTLTYVSSLGSLTLKSNQVSVANDITRIIANTSSKAAGYNGGGIIGDNSQIMRTSYVDILNSTNFIKMHGIYQATGAIDSSGRLYTWGVNSNTGYNGVLGQGSLGTAPSTTLWVPTQVGSDTDWSDIKMSQHGLGLKTDGSLYVWGESDNGRLGLGVTADILVPTRLN